VDRRCSLEQARRFDSYTFDAWAKSILDRFRLALPAEFRPTADYVIDFKLSNKAPLELRLLGVAERAGVTETQIRGLQLEPFYKKWIAGRRIDLNAQVKPGTPWALTRAFWDSALFGGKRSTLDFQMISSLAELILRSNPQLLSALQLSYTFVFLDEFQDTTTSQFALLDTAFRNSNACITAVGDNKQRIMLWAGAQRDVFDVFTDTFDATRRTLSVNYRSAPRLIAIQNHLIAEMEPGAGSAMTAPANLPDGGECRLLLFGSDEIEANYLAGLIHEWIQGGLAPEEICILVRALPGAVEEVLRPALTSNGISVRSQDSLQDLLAEPLTRLVLDTVSVCSTRAPESWNELRKAIFEIQGVEDEFPSSQKATRGLSAFIERQRLALAAIATEKDLIAWINAIIDFLDRSSLILQHERYLQSEFLNLVIEQCAKILADAKDRCGTWPAAVDDFWGKGYIPIMSIHKSKGMEFHSVIFIGLEDFPFQRGLAKKDGEEECAIFVAFSRAKERVIITSVTQRRGWAQCHKEVAKFFNVFERAGVIPEEF
jgi:superfamily I DNA/RNA helicase